ncbi:hypothetical protein [Glaciecola sp. MH2013]|nr:hypothetical protein [Glaciecola sp. MH2013]
MFYQNRKNIGQPNNRINLATLAQDIKTCGFHARYAGCYVPS